MRERPFALRRAATCALVAMCVSAGMSQVKIDSLRAISEDMSRPDSIRFSAYFDMVWEGYLFSKPDTAFILAGQLQRDARSRSDKTFEARASELLAATWYVRGDLKTALLHYDTARVLHARNKDLDGQADVMTNMASMRSFLGERDEALRLYHEGLRIHEEIHDSVSIANDLNAIGTVHMARGDHARAADLFARSLRMHELLKNERAIATGRCNMAGLLTLQGDHANARAHYREALRIAEKLDDRHMMGKYLEELGSCDEELGDTASAMDYFQRSLRAREELQDKHGVVNASNRIATLFSAQGRSRQALDLFSQSAAMASEEELPWGLGYALVGKGKVLLVLGRNSEALAASEEADKAAEDSEDLTLQRDAAGLRFNVLRTMRRWEEALLAQSRMVSFNDSIMREENQREVLRNGYAYGYGKQAYADSISHALAAAQEAVRSAQRLSAERSWRNMVVMLGCVLALVLLVVWQRARLFKRTNASILSAQAKLIESEKALEAAEVRTRIARDVHDQLGSDLTKLVLLSGEMKALAKEDPEVFGTAADDIERIAGEANRSLGDIVWAIDPHHDSLAGLTERVRAHADRMLKRSRTDHTIECVHTGPDRSLDPATKRDIYLIMREALNNTVKYSKAQHIIVLFRTDASEVRMTVQDDGIGFDQDRMKKTGHGLANMLTRAERMGGRLVVESSVGRGTRVLLNADFTP